ncbi:hypothetical protein [Streptomyces virginiae]|uniref:hypothetical protein n=1 Tax=Streptomyces virginiae TaxID=1961 RepID=UPI0004C7CEE1|nr:hypothetical protein [Streptomyces virginiae]
MRTKPTMYKRMLRSVLAIGFSAVAVFGAVSAVESDAGSARDGQGTSLTSTEFDTGWTTAPVGRYADTGWTAAELGGKDDTGWTEAPVTVSA